MPRLNPRPYILGGINQGLSGRAAYRNMQAEAARLTEETGQNWTGIRLTVFQQMYAGTRFARQNVVEAMNAPKNVPGGGLSIPDRPSTVAGGFLYAVAAFTRPIGSADVERTIHMSRSNTLLTPQEVEDATRAQIEQSAQETHGTFTGYTIEALTFTGVEQLTQRQT